MSFGARSAQKEKSKVVMMVAPLGGLDDIDPIAAMPEQFCIQMINWFPGNTHLVARQGYKEWCIGMGAPVKTLMPYYPMTGAGDAKLFAGTDLGIFDVTNTSSTPPLSQATENGYYKFVMFGNVGFQYLVAVNGGTEDSIFYDGTDWTAFVQNETPTVPGDIKGVDPTLFNHVTVFKRRLWFIQGNSTTAWYLPIDTTGGEAKPFYLTGVFKRGGKIVYATDWNVDGGDGLDNKLIFVSDVGEIAIYVGDDPDSDTDWKLEAVFFMGSPLGERSFTNFGGDVLMLTVNGLVPLTKVLEGLMNEAPTEQAVSKRISRTLNRLINSRRYAPNWDLVNLPVLQAIGIVIPPTPNDPAIQFVMNVLTGAWTRFDMPVASATTFLGDLYFGTTDGRVCLYGGTNFLDDVAIDGTGGLPVICSLFTAYNWMGDPAKLKHWKLIRPYFQADQIPSYLIRLNTDFDFASLPGNPAAPTDNQIDPLWNEAIWDEAFWSSASTTFKPWLGVSALGNAAALLMKVASNDDVALVAIEFVYEEGGII